MKENLPNEAHNLFSLRDLNGDHFRNFSPIDQFYARLVWRSKLYLCDVSIDRSKVFLSESDAKFLFKKLKTYIGQILSGDEQVAQAAIDVWMAIGPQINQSIPKGKLFLRGGYLVANLEEFAASANEIH